MTVRGNSSQSRHENSRRDFYLVLAGLFDEIYQDKGMLSGGPFDFKRFPETAQNLLERVRTDPTIPLDTKQQTENDYSLAMSLYERYTGAGIDLREFRTTYLQERNRINGIAIQLLGSSAQR